MGLGLMLGIVLEVFFRVEVFGRVRVKGTHTLQTEVYMV